MAQCISTGLSSCVVNPTGLYSFNGHKDARPQTPKLAHMISIPLHYQPPHYKHPNPRLKKDHSKGKLFQNHLTCARPISVNIPPQLIPSNLVYSRTNRTIRHVGSCGQEHVDCDTSCNQGCEGGNQDHACMKNGIHRDKDCTRTRKDEKCNTYMNETKVITRIDGCQCHVPANNVSTLQKDESQPPFGQHVGRKLISILSIDGGGVRGIITSEILAFLEAVLRKLGGKDASLADHFDVVVGASAGGLATAMLTTPNEEGRPKFDAKGITDFYLEHASAIFPNRSKNKLDTFARLMIKDLWQPKHDGNCLRRLVRDVLQEKQLKETLTNVIIPAYDMITWEPAIFSSFRLKNNPGLNAKLSDICIGTSAAPTYLPSHSFHVNDAKGKLLREFILIDGGLFANNPTQLAINEVIREGLMNGCQLLVLSLGTGSQDFQQKYKATNPSNWGVLRWLGSPGSSPLMDVVSSSSGYIADYHCSTLMNILGSPESYYRIQEYTLSDDVASLDLATPKNMGELRKVAKELLKKPMTKMNLDTLELEYLDITNEMALTRIAELLHKERKSRMESMFTTGCCSDRILSHIN